MIQVDGVVIASAGYTFFSSSLASAALFVLRRDPSAFASGYGSGSSGVGQNILHVHTSALSNHDHLAKEVSVLVHRFFDSLVDRDSSEGVVGVNLN